MTVASLSNAPACFMYASSDELHKSEDEGLIQTSGNKFSTNLTAIYVRYKRPGPLQKQVDLQFAVNIRDIFKDRLTNKANDNRQLCHWYEELNNFPARLKASVPDTLVWLGFGGSKSNSKRRIAQQELMNWFIKMLVHLEFIWDKHLGSSTAVQHRVEPRKMGTKPAHPAPYHVGPKARKLKR